MIRIFIVDDQTIIRHGLKSLLELQEDLTVVGDAGNGQEALEEIASLQEKSQQPDVVLLDVRMPIMDGVATTQELTQNFPEIKVLILTTFDDDEYISQAMNYGAKGYLLKESPPEDLAMAIRVVNKGNTYMGSGLLEKILHRSPITSTKAKQPQQSNSILDIPLQLTELTPREREVLNLIAQGANNREIAKKLYISDKTVKNHVTSILSKLNLRDRTQAALLVNRVTLINDKGLINGDR
ncbi:MAG: response regulator transcription factor [Xenococcaceae cyanobacterium MO_188.B29]|nr:response regulator transcription factor [Xenococcaceae cyanobacterium MO_188.B29]